MTPAEYAALYRGWLWRHRMAEDRDCVWACMIINHMGTVKNPLSPVRILGRPLTGLPKVGDDS